MNYEKKYNEALERARKLYEQGTITESLCYVFPELIESEDERVRKELLSFFTERAKYTEDSTFNGLSSKEIISWFEKQGEQKPQGKSALEAIKEEKVGNANKVEPKFKDGDVLNSPAHHLIWIYKDNEHYHACLNMNYVTENVTIGGVINMPSDAHHATKDERTILFENLKKFGYEWDKEKKQLKKKVIHKELTEFEKAVKQVMEEAIECGDTRNLKADAETLLNLVHNSSWSEDDELHIRELESLVKQVWTTAEHKNDKDTIHKMSDLSFFLKTLKPQPKQEWSEEDETMFVNLVAFLEGKVGVIVGGAKKYAEWLKERYKYAFPMPQWKPSDEQMRTLEHYMHTLVCNEHKEILFGLYTDLKKLKK